MESDIRNILISGASHGLGAAFAAHYSDAGDRVFAGVGEGMVAPSGQAITLDVTSLDSVRDAVAAVMSESESIDLLVNSAAVHLAGPLGAMDMDDFKTILDVNLLGPWRLTKAALPFMRPGATIVMISSLSGLVGLPEDGAYAASKFALEGMSQSLAAEVAPLGIRVRIFEPGAVAGEFGGMTQGDDPIEVVGKMAAIIDRPEAAFRNPLGDRGAYVARMLNLDDGSGARSIVQSMTGTDWR